MRLVRITAIIMGIIIILTVHSFLCTPTPFPGVYICILANSKACVITVAHFA